MSNSNIYTAGLGNAGSYMVSGIPFASSSIDCRGQVLKVEFPYVTRWVIVRNHSFVDGETLKVGFSENGVSGSNYFSLFDSTNNVEDRASIMDPMELKITEIYLSGSRNAEVIAGLTNIAVSRVNNISPSGTNWSGSYGGIG